MQRDPVSAPAADPAADVPPRGVLIAALTLSVIAIGVVLAIAASRQGTPAPIAIAGLPAPGAQTPECQALLAALPDRLGDFERAVAAQPVPPGAAAWRRDDQSVILRCGLDRPAEFVVGSPLQVVDDVQWLRLGDAATARSTWVSVDRPVYVVLTLPDGSGPTPIQTLSEVIARTMPAMPIRPAPPS